MNHTRKEPKTHWSELPPEIGEGGCLMNILEILTLVLAIFAALTYIDNHQNKK